jgi:hypothetical protein
VRHLHVLQALGAAAAGNAFVRSASAEPGTCAASPVPTLLNHIQQGDEGDGEPEVKAYRTLTPRYHALGYQQFCSSPRLLPRLAAVCTCRHLLVVAGL